MDDFDNLNSKTDSDLRQIAVAFGDFTYRHVAVSHFAPDHFVNFVHDTPPLLS